jgi:hypothetical protein
MREELLGERKSVFTRSIVGHQQPPGAPFLHAVNSIAGRPIKYLSHKRVEVIMDQLLQ